MVLRGNGEEYVDAFLESSGVLPKQIVKEDPHGGHAEALRPTQFSIDAFGSKSCGLPHFEFVDGIGGKIVAAHEPRLLGVPGVGGFSGPAGRSGEIDLKSEGED